MNSFFYLKLAFQNLKKNSKMVVPYLLSGTLFVMMFFVILALSLHPEFAGRTRGMLLSFGVYVIAIFAIIFMFYTNSFIIKQRKSELGLYNILGMEKKHISRTLFYETVLMGGFSIIVGILCGILFGQAIFLMLVKMVGALPSMNFEFDTASIKNTVLLYAGIYVMTAFYNVSQIQLAKPIDLIKSKSAGEKEPKTKWLMTLLGVLCLGGGYLLAVMINDPIETLVFFFVAVILVILGTYFLFTAGSVALLKLLRRNKNYYYKTSHFVSVSNMIYRMKQNAVGLANICILSTMVLVMVSSTGSLFIGIDDQINMQTPRDVNLEYNAEDLEVNQLMDAKIMEKLEHIDKSNFTRRYDFSFIMDLDGTHITPITDDYNHYGDYYYVFFSTDAKLNEGEAAVYFDDGLQLESLQIGDVVYSISNINEKTEFTGALGSNIGFKGLVYITVKDEKAIQQIYETVLTENGERYYTPPGYAYRFDTTLDESQQDQLIQEMEELVSDLSKENGIGYSYQFTLRKDFRESIYDLFGSFFFLGIFLSILFMIATVLIMYYKQISEGHDDVKRFEILQKVGMSHEEVKKSIHSQILIVFFMPLITAGIHIMFAFNMIYQLFMIFGLTNRMMLMSIMGIVYAVFSLFYFIVYQLTAKAYYKIVS